MHPMLTAVEKLGAHQVIGLIGSGGMGEVYQALDTKLGRDVLILGRRRLVMPAKLSRAFRRVYAVKFLGQS